MSRSTRAVIVAGALLALFCLQMAPLGAQENPAVAVEPDSAPAALSASGYVKANGVWAPGIAAPASQISQAGLIGSLRLELDLDRYGLLVGNTELFSNLGSLGLVGSGSSSAVSLYPLAWRFDLDGRVAADLDIKELYYENSLGDFDLRLGKQIFAWGLADGNNPTDILNARHVGIRTGATAEENKMGALALDVVWNLADGKSKIEGVFLPFSVVNDIPIPITTTRVVTGSGFSPNVDIALLAAERPGWAVENFEGALRGLFYLDSFSFSVSYLTVLDRYPDIRSGSYTISGSPPITPNTVVNTQTPIYKRIHAFGLDWATTIEGFDFRGEWLLSLTDDLAGTDYLVKNSTINGIVQLSRTWFDGNLITGLSWAPRIILAHKAYDSYATASDQQAAYQIYCQNGQGFTFENGLGLRVEAKLVPEVLSVTIFGLYNLAAEDYLAQLSADWAIADGWKLRTGGNLYGSFRLASDPLRAFGTFAAYDNKDSLFLELVFSY